MKKYILIVLAIFVCSSIYGQKNAAARSAVRQAYKTSIKQNVRNGAKTASKNAVKNSLQEAMVNRTSKAVVRKNLASEMRRSGFISLSKQCKSMLSSNLSKVRISTVKSTFNSRILSDKMTKTQISKSVNAIKSKGSITLTDKELNELLNNPQYLRTYISAYTGDKKNFQEFFIRLSMGNKNQVSKIMNNPVIRKSLDKRIRHGGGDHEWLMTKNFTDYLVNPKWGDDGPFLSLALTKLVQRTEAVVFKYGGKHGSTNSKIFHKGLAHVIESCNTKEELFVNVREYAKKNLSKESYADFLRVYKSVLSDKI